MLQITRQRAKSIDRTVGPWDFQQAMALWVQLFHLCTGARRPDNPAYCFVAAEFWGFPRAQSEAFLRALQMDAASRGLTELTFEWKDQDTLRAQGPVSPVDALADFSPLFAFCMGGPAEGLACALRLTVKDTPVAAEQVEKVGNTLVFFGRIHGGALELRAIWPVGVEGSQEALCKSAAWPDEKRFLALLEAPPHSVTKAPEWSKMLFVKGVNRSMEKAITWYLAVNDRSLGSFVLRLAVSAAIAGVAVLGLMRQGGSSLFFAIGLWLPLLLGGLGFLFHLVLEVVMLVAYRVKMREGLQRVYSRTVDFPEVDAVSLGGNEDPTTRKISADLESAGAMHVKDVRIEPNVPGQRFTRIYLLPDGAGYFCLSPMFGESSVFSFPSLPVFLLKTYLADGAEVVTTNAKMGYRKKLQIPVVARNYPDVRDAFTMMARHEAFVARMEKQHGGRAQLDPATIVERMIYDHERVRPLMAERGYYGWSDAIRETFDLVRKEFRD